MKKAYLWLIVIALTATLALACKEDEDLQKELIVTDIPSTYNSLRANIALTQVTTGTTVKAKAEAKINGGSVTFALIDNDGNPFTEGGLNPYQATLSIFDANGTTVGGYIGILTTVWITQKTATVSFKEFKGTGTGK